MLATTLKLKLWGTITGNGIGACAIIEAAGKREQKLYRAGETVQNATLKIILRGKVVLEVEGKYEMQFLGSDVAGFIPALDFIKGLRFVVPVQKGVAR